jgi:PAS domain S-box-containing protein
MPDANDEPATPRSALRRSEERFRLLVESVVDYAIFMLDPHGVVQSWNVGAQRLKGYHEEEIVGRHYSTFYTDEDRADRLPDRLLVTALKQGRVQISGWRVRKDGSRFWADVLITALYDETGTHTGFAKVTRDMTDAHVVAQEREKTLREQEHVVERLQELDRWRVEFTRSVVHDLQSPVMAIAGFAELLGEDGELDEECRSWLEHITSNARALQELIDHLRTHTRLAHRQVRVEPRRVLLRATIERLLADMAPLLAGRHVDTRVGELEVYADPGALDRILRNLVGNAARHTPPGTPIHIVARADGDEVVVGVEDEGPGISPDLLPYVFDRYERGEQGGTGLGLAIAKQYVELHAGTITVDSAAGRGTAFRFTLPNM